MRTPLWVFLVSLWVLPNAWAEYQVTPTKRFDLGPLTSEFATVLGGAEITCEDTWGTITCRKITGDFTDAEKTAMAAAVVAHDPDIIAKRKAQQQEEEQEVPIEAFGAGVAGALTALGGKNLVLRVAKKKATS